MQLDSAPLCAADIAPELKRQFAFLSGDTSLYLYPLCLSVCVSVFFCSLHQFVFLYLTSNQSDCGLQHKIIRIIMGNYNFELVAYVHSLTDVS